MILSITLSFLAKAIIATITITILVSVAIARFAWSNFAKKNMESKKNRDKIRK